MQPTTFEVKGKEISFTGYEMGWDLAAPVNLNGTVAAMGICSGEGESWIQNYLISRKDSAIEISEWDGDISQWLLGKAAQKVLNKCAEEMTPSAN
ncbi:hypothetical protein [Rhizobium mongolense]|uniref:Uncharacterized protein n=2 Tax=Rhizobium mongolense TaxID=57676 RepID=A0ABR6IW76_9HYPH|nr:hypothetical protein [Rhizobium mongolense]MBB4232170.1 hypothetical protein [Rhizobium mongolense]TVZ63109.1 hypothetical protein BCL32_3226 [Rhizobium mongolense USDA 1844]